MVLVCLVISKSLPPAVDICMPIPNTTQAININQTKIKKTKKQKNRAPCKKDSIVSTIQTSFKPTATFQFEKKLVERLTQISAQTV
jgi:hypothetical protein